MCVCVCVCVFVYVSVLVCVCVSVYVSVLVKLVAGGNLETIVNGNHHMNLNESLTCFASVCVAVAHLHSQRPSIVHRDLKVCKS